QPDNCLPRRNLALGRHGILEVDYGQVGPRRERLADAFRPSGRHEEGRYPVTVRHHHSALADSVSSPCPSATQRSSPEPARCEVSVAVPPAISARLPLKLKRFGVPPCPAASASSNVACRGPWTTSPE